MTAILRERVYLCSTLLAGLSLIVTPGPTRSRVTEPGNPDPAAAVSAARARSVTPARPVSRGLALQVALDRAGFSAGEIDGHAGDNTRRALRAFQESRGLAVTGREDRATIAAIEEAHEEPLVSYTVTLQDAAGPFVPHIPDDIMAQGELAALGYTSAVEMLAERFHCSPTLLRRLNPEATFAAGETISVPNVEPFQLPQGRGKRQRTAGTNGGGDLVVHVSGEGRVLQVRDGAGRLIMHAPVTVGSEKDPLPVGEWQVVGVFDLPVFNYNPDLFWDADPAHAKAKIQPGPNNPVGVIWVDVNKEHLGVHGAPEPSRVGHTQSHGCIRLTNWDVTRLASLVGEGTKVILK